MKRQIAWRPSGAKVSIASAKVRVARATAALAAVAALSAASCATKAVEPAAPKLLVLVESGGEVAPWFDGLAAELVAAYGEASSGGRVLRVAVDPDALDRLPPNALEAFASDPRIGAVLVPAAPAGAAEAFKAIRALRNDLLLVASSPASGAAELAASADLVLDLEPLERGWSIPWTARQLGAKTFVHVAYPRALADPAVKARRDLMRLSCRELELEFVELETPDPAAGKGPQAVYTFVSARAPLWIGKYGKSAAFFAVDDVIAEPLMEAVKAYGGFFPETARPSARTAFPFVFMLDPGLADAPYAAALAALEAAASKNGAAGRFGVWTAELDAALAEAAARATFAVLDSGAPIDAALVARSLEASTPGEAWAVSAGFDFAARAALPSLFGARMDTWMLGKGASGSAGTKPPEALLVRVTGSR